jgi:hypothetical protein
MEIKDIQRKELKEEDKKLSITIRIQREISDWMKFRTVSPTSLFEKTALELMSKDLEWNKNEKKKSNK